MPTLTDPLDALMSFQRALQRGGISPIRGELDPGILVYRDEPNGELRLTYARLEGQRVASLVNFAPTDPIEPAIPCFSIGYAVHEKYRGQGRAKSLVEAAIAELANGLTRNGRPVFHIEAIVGANNIASQKVAQATISSDGKPGMDQFAKVPILQFVRKIAE